MSDGSARRVSVVSGQYQGFLGTVVQQLPDSRCLVRFLILGQEHLEAFPKDFLRDSAGQQLSESLSDQLNLSASAALDGGTKRVFFPRLSTGAASTSKRSASKNSPKRTESRRREQAEYERERSRADDLSTDCFSSSDCFQSSTRPQRSRVAHDSGNSRPRQTSQSNAVNQSSEKRSDRSTSGKTDQPSVNRTKRRSRRV